MSQTIWKYQLQVTTDLKLPAGSRVLSVGNQEERVVLWAMIDPKSSKIRTRRFRIYLTGEEFNGDPGIFIGTVQLKDQMDETKQFVCHVFETL